ncbi:MAG: hypothetical protein FJ104_13645 [Deltaproteobacteria bacterium]|nr:hypothetical protein [Deltaproteobacteria bacterium]
MNLKQTAWALVGGGLVYVALAARVGSAGPSFTEALGDPVPPAQADVSGTRLKSKYIAGADGSRLVEPDVLFDSQLGVDCRFGKAADGAVRCVPADVTGGGWLGAPFFKDDACTDGVTFVAAPPPGCAPSVPAHVVRFTAPAYCSVVRSSADQHAHVYAVGQVVPRPSGPMYYVDGDGSCREQVNLLGALPQGAITYDLGTELPASTFAAGTAGVDP